MECFAHRTVEDKVTLRKAKDHILAQQRHVTRMEPYTGPYLKEAANSIEMQHFISIHGNGDSANYRGELQRIACILWSRDIASRKRIEKRKVQQSERKRYKARLNALWSRGNGPMVRYARATFLDAIARAKAVNAISLTQCFGSEYSIAYTCGHNVTM